MQPDLTSLSEDHRTALLRVLERAKETKRARFDFLPNDYDVFAYPRADGQWMFGINGKHGSLGRWVSP
jgi:hypothetical protein